jgi:uncharacterized protein (TIGR02569 family)
VRSGEPTLWDVTSSDAGTPDAVLVAFGVTDVPVVLPGGKGGTWRAGRLVLKPVEFLAETLWRAEVLTALPESTGFRVARPVRALDGAWVADNWEAYELVAGEPDVRRQDDVLRAGIAFHTAIADLPRPAFLDLRDDPWDWGDRVAWEEVPVRACPVAMDLLAPLVRSRRPVDLTSQVVHGDLPGNVLFAPGLPPAIIDWPVYWRPVSWALAVAVADALCWYGASPELAVRWAHLPAWGQMLVRALIYRIATHEAAFGPAGWTPDQVEAYRPVVDLAVAHA